MAGAEQRLLLARQGAAATGDQSTQKVRGLFIASVLPCGGGGADAAELSMRKPTHLNPQQFPGGRFAFRQWKILKFDFACTAAAEVPHPFPSWTV
jgi:hypothetical protein